MSYWADRAKMTVSGTPGTGTVTLSAAVAPYQTFAAAGVINGQTVSYLIEEGTTWELGRGVYTSATKELTRGVVSSSGGGLMSFTSSAYVSIVMLSEDVASQDDLVGLGGGGGDFVKISSGTVSSFAASVDIALSGAYSSYKLLLSDIYFSSYADWDNVVSMLFSYDDGATWLADDVNYDTYSGGITDTGLALNAYIGPQSAFIGVAFDLSIYPGSETTFGSVVGITNHRRYNTGTLSSFEMCGGALNEEATVPPSPGRVNKIRLVTENSLYGAPSGFNKMNWTLYGVN